MYWVRTIDEEVPYLKSKKYTWLLCNSFDEFIEDTLGVIGAAGLRDAQTGKIKRIEARKKEKAKGIHPLNFRNNPHLSLRVKAMMEESGAVVSAAVETNLHQTRDEEIIREVRELIINKKEGGEFYTAQAFIPGYESIFDGTINKKGQNIIKGEIETNPAYADAYCDIAGAYHENHDYAMAVEFYSMAIKIDPRNADTYYCRGGSYCLNGELENALNDLTESLKIDPSNKIVKDLSQWIKNKIRA